MEKEESTAATEQANENTSPKDNFSGFDDVNKDSNTQDSFKSVEEMPKEASTTKGFDELEKELSNEPKSEQKDEEKEKKDAEKTPETTAEIKKEAKKDDTAGKDTDISEEDKAPELAIDETRFKLEKSDESESTWSTLGKDLGIELKEDSYEAFKESIDTIKQQAREEGKAEASKIELEKLTPQAQKAIEYLNANPQNTIEDFINPLKRIDEVLVLDNESLLRKDFEARGWEADRIDEKMEILKDEGKLESEAYGLRKDLENVRATTESQIVEDAKNEAAARTTMLQQQYEKESKEVLNILAETKTFMGFKIPDNARQYIQKQWESGEVRKAFQSNSKDVVDFMLNKYLGQDALKELKKTSFQKGRDDIQGKLHNTKDLSNSETSGRREVSTKKVGAGAFDAWEEVDKDNATVDSNGY
jgi:hypothetical protein